MTPKTSKAKQLMRQNQIHARNRSLKKKITIQVATLDGQIFRIKGTTKMTIWDIKEKVSKLLTIPPFILELYIDDHVDRLYDGKRLNSYSIINNTMLFAIWYNEVWRFDRWSRGLKIHNNSVCKYTREVSDQRFCKIPFINGKLITGNNIIRDGKHWFEIVVNSVLGSCTRNTVLNVPHNLEHFQNKKWTKPLKFGQQKVRLDPWI